MKKKTPKFKNEDEERAFWSNHDSAEHVDWQKAKRVVLSNLKPSVKAISLRSVSEVANDAVREALAEDAEDIAAFEERITVPLIACDEMVKRLRRDGCI